MIPSYNTPSTFKWTVDYQSVIEQYSGGGSDVTCSCSLYGGGGIGISPAIMELYKDGSTIIRYGPGSLDGGWWSPVKCAALEVMYPVVEFMLLSWSHGALRQKKWTKIEKQYLSLFSYVNKI